jgi:hypothetical protein
MTLRRFSLLMQDVFLVQKLALDDGYVLDTKDPTPQSTQPALTQHKMVDAKAFLHADTHQHRS